MSTVLEPTQKIARSQRTLTSGERDAIIAACAAGAHKGDLAKEFGIRRETISRVLANVKTVSSESNPLSSDYKPSMKAKAVKAINRALDHRRDPYAAANIAVKVMSGIGEFVSGAHVQVEGHVALTVTWLPTQMPEYESDNEKVIDTPHALISD